MRESLTAPDLQAACAAPQPPTVIDVRSVSEYASGHIAGAINIPLPELQVRRDDLRGERLVFVCERGIRAQAAQTALAPCFPSAQVLQGGMHAWREANLPMIHVTRTRWSLERQVRSIAGSLILMGIVLSLTVSPLWWMFAALPAAGLVFAGLTDICPMAIFLLRLPWNHVCSTATATTRPKGVSENYS
jgi:rhodanese-related sulfurtransferase